MKIVKKWNKNKRQLHQIVGNQSKSNQIKSKIETEIEINWMWAKCPAGKNRRWAWHAARYIRHDSCSAQMHRWRKPSELCPDERALWTSCCCCCSCCCSCGCSCCCACCSACCCLCVVVVILAQVMGTYGCNCLLPYAVCNWFFFITSASVWITITSLLYFPLWRFYLYRISHILYRAHVFYIVH